jgi:hypothetical protein
MISGDEPIMMWKQSCPTSKYYLAMRHEGLRNTTKHLSHDSQWPGTSGIKIVSLRSWYGVK